MSRIRRYSGVLFGENFGNMSWLWETRVYNSNENGTIVVKRWLGCWSIEVQGYQQTGDNSNAIWRDACNRVQLLLPTKNIQILILGLGTGGVIQDLHRLFPGCSVTAIEYDKVMIRLCQELQLYKPYAAPTIIYGDAGVLVPTLEKRFDLVLIDLFFRQQTSCLSKRKVIP